MENQEVVNVTTAKETEKKPATKKAAKAAPMRLSFRAVTADEIDVRVQNINAWKTTVLLYMDARVDQNILDETVGCFNWQKEYSRDNQNCMVSIWDDAKKQWISKEDTGTESNTEKEKGLASDSFKRACFCWGIGRELYTTPLVQIPTEFIDVRDNNGRKSTYDKFFVQDIEVTTSENGTKRITRLTIGIEHSGKKEWVWSWGGGDEIRTHKPSWCNKNDSQNANQQNGNWNSGSPAQQSNQSSQSSGWGSRSGGLKGSFSHGSYSAAPTSKWRT